MESLQMLLVNLLFHSQKLEILENKTKEIYLV